MKGDVQDVERGAAGLASLPAIPFLDPDQWAEQAGHHAARLRPWVQPHLRRRDRREKHPVIDFLFDYYPFRPAALMRWGPGWSRGGRGAAAQEAFGSTARRQGLQVWLDVRDFPAHRVNGLRWVIQLLQATAGRDGRFDCLGLHEWAMVYATEDVRHPQLPLRLSHAEVRQVVDTLPVTCSHFDAFRFFSREARPLNRIQPGPQDRGAWEQPGCLHANMDLYKWAFKFHPWTTSDLIADTFLLAQEIRSLDMRASPYDVSVLGYEPVPIETPQGRIDYAREQRQLSQRAQPLRERLTAELRALLAAVAPQDPSRQGAAGDRHSEKTPNL